MRALLLPFCALLALGCSADPSPADAGADGAVPFDGGADAGALPDAGDASTAADAPRTDAGDAGRADAADVVAVPDAPAVDVVDGGAGDAADAGVAVVVDAPAVEDAPDAPPADAGVAVGDTGPVDAGPQVYALDPPPGALEVRVLLRSTCAAQDGGPCGFDPITTVRSGSCVRTGSRLNFTVDVGYSITGLVPDYRSAAGASVAVVGGGATQGRDLEVVAGAEVGGRQSFRVSFSAPATPSVSGITGVPGRTVDPARGDVWLLGCEVR